MQGAAASAGGAAGSSSGGHEMNLAEVEFGAGANTRGPLILDFLIHRISRYSTRMSHLPRQARDEYEEGAHKGGNQLKKGAWFCLRCVFCWAEIGRGSFGTVCAFYSIAPRLLPTDMMRVQSTPTASMCIQVENNSGAKFYFNVALLLHTLMDAWTKHACTNGTLHACVQSKAGGGVRMWR